jgi:hypothetical protein
MHPDYLNYVLDPQLKLDFYAAIEEAAGKITFASDIQSNKKKHQRKIGAKRIGLANIMRVAANVHKSILPLDYDPQQFNDNMTLYQDVDDMLAFIYANVVAPLLAAKGKLGHQIMGHTDFVHGFLKLQKKGGNSAVIDLLIEAAKFTKHKNIRITTAKGTVSKGSGAAANMVAVGSKFKNTGNTVLDISKGLSPPADGDTSIIRVPPDTTVKLPKGFDQIYIKNISQDMDGAFTLKLRLDKDHKN